MARGQISEPDWLADLPLLASLLMLDSTGGRASPLCGTGSSTQTPFNLGLVGLTSLDLHFLVVLSPLPSSPLATNAVDTRATARSPEAPDLVE